MAKRAASNIDMRPAFQIRDRDRERQETGDYAMSMREWRTESAVPSEPSASEDGPGPVPGDVRNSELLVLLGQIGQRLRQSEHEREALKETLNDVRTMVEGLESRSEQSEKIFLTLQDKLSKQESAEENLRRRQQELEARQAAQSERVEKAAGLTDRIEEALMQQNRLNRRLDKAGLDKARFIRKLERIEQTVAETQTALQSKALVLLTDRANVPQTAVTAVPAMDDAALFYQPSSRHFPQMRTRFGLSRRALTLLLLVALGVAGGLGFTIFKSRYGLPDVLAIEPASGNATAANLPLPAPLGSAPVPVPNIVAQRPPLSAAVQAPATAPVIPDALHMSDEQLNAQFDKDPAALAAALNAIAPSTPAPVAPVLETPASLTANAALPAVHEAGFDSASFIKSQTPAGTLSARLHPDPALPSMVKDVETQAFNGLPEAQHDLAATYTAGRDGVAVNYPKAAAWFLESATHGIANAQYNLGVLNQQGLGVPKNIGLAMNWYRAAAEQNHPQAAYNLGIARLEGMGGNADPGLAARYFQLAARQGVTEASNNLGRIYEKGLLGKPDTRQALYWYRTASDQGSPEGKAALARLSQKLKLSTGAGDKIYNDIKKATRAAGPVVQPATTASTASANPTVPDTDRTTLAQIQSQLLQFGLFVGPADGVDNAATEEAIRSYQRLSSLPTNGRPSRALLINMMSSELGDSLKSQASQSSAPIVPDSDTLRPDERQAPSGDYSGGT